MLAKRDTFSVITNSNGVGSRNGAFHRCAQTPKFSKEFVDSHFFVEGHGASSF
jgi:hypothetical protein